MALRATIPGIVLAAALVWKSEQFALERFQPNARPYAAMKRAFDVVCASLALVVALPVMALACLLIAAETKGSPFFRQNRVGIDGTSFELFKLRTMYVGTEHLGCRTLENDPRITRVGGILRKTRIDELPQLLNILKGEMSIIGPRPLSVTETEAIIESEGFNSHHPGLKPTVRPGLIGLEQVNRNRSLTFADRFELNAHYEQQFGLGCDMQIFQKAVLQCWQLCALLSLAGVGECVFICIR